MDSTKYAITSKAPQYGINYKAGYIGFTFDDDSVVSNGIAYFTRWDDLCGIPVSHVLIVTGENDCVESIMGQGVVESNIDKYFNDEHCHIFFRKPMQINEIVQNEIIKAAKDELGANYANGAIVNDAIRATLLGHLLDNLTHKKIFDALSTLLDNQEEFICSELAAYCLKSAKSWEPYNHKGILGRPAVVVTPQALFCDDVIFEQWK